MLPVLFDEPDPIRFMVEREEVKWEEVVRRVVAALVVGLRLLTVWLASNDCSRPTNGVFASGRPTNGLVRPHSTLSSGVGILESSEDEPPVLFPEPDVPLPLPGLLPVFPPVF